MPIKHAHCSYCGRRFADKQAWPRRCAACGETSFQNPVPVAVALVPVQDGLLVIRRGIEPHRGKLALPGGYVDWGETWQQACVREVHEETGLLLSSAEAITERRVLSALPGLLLIFGEARPSAVPPLSPFSPTDETTERLVVKEPIELAFPLHTEVMREWFLSRKAKG
jgi:8-oxo-dGTP pyrophosphatase MutT (NUDIX family)